MNTSNPPSLASALAFLRSQIPPPESGASGAPLAGIIFPLRSEDPRRPADAGQHDTPNAEPDRTPSGGSAQPRNSEHETRNSEPETPPSAFGGTRRRDTWTPFLARTGRPAIFTPELVTEISENIQRYGMSDTCAARNAGVSSSTVSRWKQELPQFVEYLGEARDAFEREHLHRIEVFKRKDGQCDPYCSRWLLQKGVPEKYGPISARRNSEHGTRNSPRSEVSRGPAHAGETASKKPPKPGTPEFWATVEEEPLPRNLSTCIMTPGRVKFYSTIHLVSMPYRPDIDPNEPSVDCTPEQQQAEQEALFTLQEHYFSLPKEERLPYLHQVLEQEFGKVLSPEERSATDALVGGTPPTSSFPNSSSPSLDQTPENLPKTPATTQPGDAASRPMGSIELAAGRVERGEQVSPAVAAASAGTSASSSSPSLHPPPSPVEQHPETPRHLPETQPTAEPVSSETSASGSCPSSPSCPNPPTAAATPAPSTKTGSGPLTRNSELGTRNSLPTPQPPTPYQRPIFRVKRRCISPDNPAWPQYQADLQREAMEEKLAEMEQLQAQGKPAEPTHEAALAQYQQLVRQEQERQNRENEAFFNRPDDQDEEPVTDCF